MRFTYAAKLNLRTAHGKRYEHLTGRIVKEDSLLVAGAAVVGAAVRMGVVAVAGCLANFGKGSCEQRLNCSVRGACGACVHLDARLTERVNRAAADAAANEYIDAAL